MIKNIFTGFGLVLLIAGCASINLHKKNWLNCCKLVRKLGSFHKIPQNWVKLPAGPDETDSPSVAVAQKITGLTSSSTRLDGKSPVVVSL